MTSEYAAGEGAKPLQLFGETNEKSTKVPEHICCSNVEPADVPPENLLYILRIFIILRGRALKLTPKTDSCQV